MPRKTLFSPVLWFFILLTLISAFALAGPPERSLGNSVRIVYLHGAWVWTSLACFIAAAAAGAYGLLTGKIAWHRWSRALGRTGLFFWITYLPLSMWAAQTNWNGLFLAEPRWRLAMVFSLGGLALQVGVSLLEDPSWASAGNLVFLALLGFSLANTEQVMHPPSPILTSDVWRIQLFFAALLGLVLLLAWQMARWWLQREAVNVAKFE